MTERLMPKIPEGLLTPEQVQKISGGEFCSADEWQSIFAGLQQNYETLIEFTSYVIERVADSVSP